LEDVADVTKKRYRRACHMVPKGPLKIARRFNAGTERLEISESRRDDCIATKPNEKISRPFRD
jgi:hypothetical protein